MTETIDWDAFIAELDGIAVITDPAMVRNKSRDFYWYSPILKQQLDDKTADIVVQPKTEKELIHVAGLCARRGIPLTVRGAGTGNYGQAVPLAGGVILETTKLNDIIAIDQGKVRTQAGVRIYALHKAVLKTGQELLMFPSTRRTATIGGFIAGGSAGIGSIRHGMLKDPGNVTAVRVVTCEDQPRMLELKDAAIQKVHHAYGTNGVITELEIALAPAENWINCIAVFDSYLDAIRFGKELGAREDILKMLICTVESRIIPFFKPLLDRLPEDKHAVLSMVAEQWLPDYQRVLAKQGGVEVLRMSDQELQVARLPNVYEFAFNHTTLQALKVDKTITYLQSLFPAPVDERLIEHFMDHFGGEVLMHHEFAKLDGHIVAFALQLVRYTNAERLYQIIRYFEDHGCPVFDPHTYVVEDGGMKEIDPQQIAFKQFADPKGLMNPGKTRGWLELQQELQH